jgi:nitrogen-specific signal transduction histidine kinase
MGTFATLGSNDAPAGDQIETDEATARLEEVCVMLSRVVHDVNNPLAIISGNAQLLVEISRGMGLGQDLAKPLGDIEEAAQVLADRLAGLSALRENVERALADGHERG